MFGELGGIGFVEECLVLFGMLVVFWFGLVWWIFLLEGVVVSVVFV